MSTVRKPLAIDEPVCEPPVLEEASQPASRAVLLPVWREWSPASRAASFRFPPEFMQELGKVSKRTGVSQAQIILLGVTELLDRGDDAILEGAPRVTAALAAGARAARAQP